MESHAPFLKKLREAHAAFATEDARLVHEVRSTVRMETDLVAHDQTCSGLESARSLAAIADGVIQVHLDTLAPAAGLAAFALGGYGRGELNPASDIDLMALVENGSEEARQAAADLVRFLWDVGFEVGHAVRTLDETAEVMRSDIPSATAVLEARSLWGAADLQRRLSREVVAGYLEERRDDYIAAKIEEAQDRHRFYGGSPCIVEPNVKESPGGLRDMHVAQWIARARTGRRDFEELRETGGVSTAQLEETLIAYATIHRVRNTLHRLDGKRQDVLDAATQPRAAEALGFRDVGGRVGAEDLMRVVTGAARRIHQFLEEVISFHQTAGPEHGRRRVQSRREVATGFVSVGDGLFLGRPDVYRGEGAARRMMRTFLLAQRHRLTVGEEVVIAIRHQVAEVGESIRSDPEVIQIFRSLLQGRRGVASVLRDMHRAELLGELLPEFGQLTGLVRIDGYHRYTVDEHSLRTVEALEAFEEEDGFLRDEFLRVLRPDLLRLAALLHDTGKAAGPDHEAAGADRIVDVARRLGFGEEDMRILHGLTLHHTVLAEMADRRLLEEVEGVVAAAAGSAERLRMLLLLNVADVRAVGRSALPEWRLDQIRRLFERVRDRLETLPSPDASAGFEARLVAAAGPERAEAAEVHAGLVPPRYRLEVEPEVAADHLALIERLRSLPVAASFGPDGRIWIASQDQPARFAQIAGALTAVGLDVRSAEAFTRRDGVVLDVFAVLDEDGEPVTDAGVVTRIEESLAGPWSEVESAIRSRRGRFRPEEPQAPVPITVRISNKVSPRHTVVDVVAADRAGLLYDLARSVSDHGFDIRFARVGTRGHRIADAFYLSGPEGRIVDREALDRLRDDLLLAAAGEGDS